MWELQSSEFWEVLLKKVLDPSLLDRIVLEMNYRVRFYEVNQSLINTSARQVLIYSRCYWFKSIQWGRYLISITKWQDSRRIEVLQLSKPSIYSLKSAVKIFDKSYTYLYIIEFKRCLMELNFFCFFRQNS